MDTTQLSKPKQALIAEALTDGYKLTSDDSFIDLEKDGTQGLRIYADGQGYSLAVMRQNVSAARCMRSVQELRSILDLPAPAPAVVGP